MQEAALYMFVAASIGIVWFGLFYGIAQQLARVLCETKRRRNSDV